MCIASALELAKIAEENGLSEEYILPTMDEWEIYPRQATETALKAIEQGIARKKMSKTEIYDRAESIINRTQKIVTLLMKEGLIPSPPPDL
jgi:malate dehydrogenase (oxaloacetate-decarboxylating)